MRKHQCFRRRETRGPTGDSEVVPEVGNAITRAFAVRRGHTTSRRRAAFRFELFVLLALRLDFFLLVLLFFLFLLVFVLFLLLVLVLLLLVVFVELALGLLDRLPAVRLGSRRGVPGSLGPDDSAVLV